MSPHSAEVIWYLMDPAQTDPPESSKSLHSWKGQVFEALTVAIDRMGLDGPNLFILEDLHWIDPTTQEFLEHLSERVAQMRSLFVCTYRPDHTPSFIGQPRVSLINLSRFEDHQSAKLIGAVVQKDALPPDVASEIIDRADGIPLFLEELTKSAVETKSDLRRKTPWSPQSKPAKDPAWFTAGTSGSRAGCQSNRADRRRDRPKLHRRTAHQGRPHSLEGSKTYPECVDRRRSIDPFWRRTERAVHVQACTCAGRSLPNDAKYSPKARAQPYRRHPRETGAKRKRRFGAAPFRSWPVLKSL